MPRRPCRCAADPEWTERLQVLRRSQEEYRAGDAGMRQAEVVICFLDADDYWGTRLLATVERCSNATRRAL